MRGHETILRMREQGNKPSFVFLNDYPCDTDWFENGHTACVCVDGDSPAALDLRFLVGLSVSVCSHDEKRAKAIFERCKEAGVDRVAACHIQRGVPPGRQCGWGAGWKKEVVHG